MAKKRTEWESPDPVCRSCHHPKLIIQHIHWLKFPDEKTLRGHLAEELEAKDSEFLGGRIDSIINWNRTVRQFCAGRTDSDGSPLPLWKAYLAKHGKLPKDHRERDAKVARTRAFLADKGV